MPRDPVKYHENHSTVLRKRHLHRLRYGQSYMYHRGDWSIKHTVDDEVRATVHNLRKHGKITTAIRRNEYGTWDYIAQGLVE